jgi:hypothetical protein
MTPTDRRTRLRHYKLVLGFTRFRRRCLAKAATAWTLIALSDTCRRLHRLKLA